MKREEVKAYYQQIRRLDIRVIARELLGGRITSETDAVMQADCPRHVSGSKRSFHVYPHEARWRCWGCPGQPGGDVIHLLEFVRFGTVTQHVTGRMTPSHRIARDELATKAGLRPLSQAGLNEEQLAAVELEHREAEAAFAVLTDLAEIFAQNALDRPDVLEWIRKQWGFDVDAVRRHRIGLAIPGGQWSELLKRGHSESSIGSSGAFNFSDRTDEALPFFRGRIVFPYFQGGRVVYLIGRRSPWCEDSQYEAAKYKKLPTRTESRKQISPAIDNRVLWGEDILLTRPSRLIVTEGVTDAIAAQDAGFPVVSPVTTRLAREDLARLVRKVKDAGVETVYLVNDSELSGVGEHTALDTAHALEEEGVRCLVATLPLGDRETAARKEFDELLGASTAAAWRVEVPAKRRKLLERELAGDATKLARALELIEGAKVDLCSHLAGGGSAVTLEGALAAARSPIEVAIEHLPAEGSEVAKVEHAEPVLRAIARLRPIARDATLKILSERIGIAVTTLRKELTAAGKRAALDEKRKTTRTAAPAASSSSSSGPSGCRELIDREREAAAAARVPLDWGVLAERVYGWIEANGGRFFRTHDGHPILLWSNEVYEMRADGTGARTTYEGLLWELAGVSPTSAGERRLFAVLSALAGRRGGLYVPLSWQRVIHAERTVYLALGEDEGRQIVKLTAEGVEIVANGTDGVILRPSQKMAPFQYDPNELGADDCELDGELERLIVDRFACDSEHARILVDWISTVFLIEFAGTRPAVRLEGAAYSGKSWATKVLSTLIFGDDTQKSSTQAANWASSARDPVVFLENVEEANVTPELVQFVLTTVTGVTREKRAAGSDSAVVSERPMCLILTNGIEPLGGDLQEVNSRSIVVEFDQARQKGNLLEREWLTDVRAARPRILSALLRRTAKVLRLMRDGCHAKALSTLRAALGDHDRRRCDEYFALMYLQRVVAAGEDGNALLEVADSRFVKTIQAVNHATRATARDASSILLGMVALFTLLESDVDYRGASGIHYRAPSATTPALIENLRTEELYTALKEVAKRRGIALPYRNAVQFGRRLSMALPLLTERGFYLEAETDRTRSRRWRIKLEESTEFLPETIAGGGQHTNGAHVNGTGSSSGSSLEAGTRQIDELLRADF